MTLTHLKLTWYHGDFTLCPLHPAHIPWSQNIPNTAWRTYEYWTKRDNIFIQKVLSTNQDPNVNIWINRPPCFFPLVALNWSCLGWFKSKDLGHSKITGEQRVVVTWSKSCCNETCFVEKTCLATKLLHPQSLSLPPRIARKGNRLLLSFHP